MTALAAAWLGLALLLSVFAWIAAKRIAAMLLPSAAAIAALALYVPLGSPLFMAPPPGNYAVLGARIDVNEAIYVLLDSGQGEPVYYVLPYHAGRAGELQDALSGEGGVKASVNAEGGVAYEGEPPVTGDENKQAETPQFEVQ